MLRDDFGSERQQSSRFLGKDWRSGRSRRASPGFRPLFRRTLGLESDETFHVVDQVDHPNLGFGPGNADGAEAKRLHRDQVAEVRSTLPSVQPLDQLLKPLPKRYEVHNLRQTLPWIARIESGHRQFG